MNLLPLIINNGRTEVAEPQTLRIINRDKPVGLLCSYDS